MGIIQELKRSLAPGQGVVIVKKGIEERKIDNPLPIETHGRELVLRCAGAKEQFEGFRIIILVMTKKKGFKIFEYGKDSIPFGEEYKSLLNL